MPKLYAILAFLSAIGLRSFKKIFVKDATRRFLKKVSTDFAYIFVRLVTSQVRKNFSLCSQYKSRSAHDQFTVTCELVFHKGDGHYVTL